MMSDDRHIRLRDRRRRHGRLRAGRPAVRGPGRDGVPGRGGPVRRRRRQHPGAVGVDAPARLRLRLGLSGRTAGDAATASCGTPAPRCSAGARRTTRASRSGRPPSAWTSGWRWAPPAGVPPRSCRSSRLENNDAPGDHGTTVRRCATSRRTIPAAPRCWRPRRMVGLPTVAFNRGETVRNGAGLVPDQRGRGRHPHVDARTPTCIRSSDTRKNLEVRTDCWVAEILFDDALTATGVRYQRPDLTGYDTVSARREVIVTAGAIDTPKLLMLSGIGPARAPAGDRDPGPGRLAGRRRQPRRPRRGPGVLGGVAGRWSTTSTQWWEIGLFTTRRRGLHPAGPDDALRQRAVRHEHAAARLSDHRQRVLPDAQRDSGPVPGHGAAAQPATSATGRGSIRGTSPTPRAMTSGSC